MRSFFNLRPAARVVGQGGGAGMMSLPVQLCGTVNWGHRIFLFPMQWASFILE